MTGSLEAVAGRVAAVLLEIGAVGFTPDAPVTFRSGLRSPVYIDNRRLPFWPAAWATVIDGFRQMIRARSVAFDVIAGIEAAGIPHSAALGYVLQTPSVFVRKQPKAHGTRSRIEGGEVAGRRVLLVEDLVTTGGSSLSGVTALREAGAAVEDCACITSYGFREAAEAFAAAGVRLHVLAPFDAVVAEAARRGQFDARALAIVQDWARDPHGWAERYR
ncbi:MAG: orotate phosphoribosyltransferase [Anaerolineae bacterium]